MSAYPPHTDIFSYSYPCIGSTIAEGTSLIYHPAPFSHMPTNHTTHIPIALGMSLKHINVQVYISLLYSTYRNISVYQRRRTHRSYRQHIIVPHKSTTLSNMLWHLFLPETSISIYYSHILIILHMLLPNFVLILIHPHHITHISILLTPLSTLPNIGPDNQSILYIRLCLLLTYLQQNP